jgi:hypothetical protein
MPGKRTPEEIWNELEKEALEDERVERAATAKPEDVARRLAAAGFDVDAERAEARAFRDQLAQRVAARRAAAQRRATANATANTNAKRRPRRRVVVWLAAAAVAVAAGGGLLYARMSHRPLPAPPAPLVPSPRAPAPGPSNSGPPLISAEDLRQQAFAHCAASEWSACLDSFDDAARLDPAGDAAPGIQEARRKAVAELEAHPDHERKLK